MLPNKMATYLFWKGPPQSWRANPMVMKIPRATPRLRGPQRRMVLVGDREPMGHKGVQGDSGEGLGQQLRHRRQWGRAVQPQKAPMGDLGAHSLGLPSQVESAP